MSAVADAVESFRQMRETLEAERLTLGEKRKAIALEAKAAIAAVDARLEEIRKAIGGDRAPRVRRTKAEIAEDQRALEVARDAPGVPVPSVDGDGQ